MPPPDPAAVLAQIPFAGPLGMTLDAATIVVQTDLRNDAGKRVAIVTQTQAVLTPR